jgi:hypothetical protein
MMKRTVISLTLAIFILLNITRISQPASAAPPYQQADDPTPPQQPVKLIFIHHSTGENWLTDGYGNLGSTLAENNYFVSDTNYGWGPDSIGDRTDIPNWPEWFASDQTATYMDALFNESGQNAGYSRLFSDPGGENQIIMFKSCFPNSALEGSPGDSPDPEGWLSVGHAKYVYNEILPFFASRPDKLFIVITAPPLSDSTYAQNARAFNQWLLNDWLNENNYTLPNVAVFDFYNLLTDRNAHHWWNDGQIEHIVGDQDTLAYPSGDDHPSEAGSRKATEEFIPLLNIFYNRWAATAPDAPDDTVATREQPTPGQGVPLPPQTALGIDDFETGELGWEPFWDASTDSNISCALDQETVSQGLASMRIDFAIAPGSWGTCSLFFDSPQDWTAGEWLAFNMHSIQSNLPFNLILYGGTSDAVETYDQARETPVEYPGGFTTLTANWSDLIRVEWEENAGTAFEHPEQVLGLAFGVDAPQDTPYAGTFWIDNIRLETSPVYEETEPVDEDDTSTPGKGLPCLGAIIFPLGIAGFFWLFRRR